MRIKPVSAQASRDAWIMLACAVEDSPRFKRGYALHSSEGISKAKKNRAEPHLHQHVCGQGYTPNDYVRVHHHEYTGHLQRAPTYKCLGSSPDEFKRYIKNWRKKYHDL
jgi:hypothetical protein